MERFVYCFCIRTGWLLTFWINDLRNGRRKEGEGGVSGEEPDESACSAVVLGIDTS